VHVLRRSIEIATRNCHIDFWKSEFMTRPSTDVVLKF